MYMVSGKNILCITLKQTYNKPRYFKLLTQPGTTANMQVHHIIIKHITSFKQTKLNLIKFDV